MRTAQTTRDVVFARVGQPIMTPGGVGIVRHLGRVVIRVETRGQLVAWHCAKVSPAT